MDSSIIFLEQKENDFFFAVYPENLYTLVIVNELSELGRVVTLDALVTFSQDLIGNIRVTFAKNPTILPRTTWIRMYTNSTANTAPVPMDIETVDCGGILSVRNTPAPSFDVQCAEGDTQTLGEVGIDPEKFSRHVFYTPLPEDDDEKLFQKFRQYGELDYVYMTSQKKTEARLGFAKFDNPLSARLVIKMKKLPEYNCQEGRPPQQRQNERESPSCEPTHSCKQSAMTINKKMEKFHKRICKRQMKNPIDMLQFITKHRECRQWILKAELAEHKNTCPPKTPPEIWY